MKTINKKYLCNGRSFVSYGDVIAYCELNNFRVTNTQTVKHGVYLITVTSIK
jgi:hypothetical protein